MHNLDIDTAQEELEQMPDYQKKGSFNQAIYQKEETWKNLEDIMKTLN